MTNLLDAKQQYLGFETCESLDGKFYLLRSGHLYCTTDNFEAVQQAAYAEVDYWWKHYMESYQKEQFKVWYQKR